MCSFRVEPRTNFVSRLRNFLKIDIKKEVRVPPKYPLKLLVGDYIIQVESYDAIGSWNSRTRTATGVSGTGWINFSCGGMLQILDGLEVAEGFIRVKSRFEVVSSVINSQTEISLDDAKVINPQAKVGESLELYLDLSQREFQDVVQRGIGLSEQFLSHKGDVLVEFHEVTIKVLDYDYKIGRIVKGNAVYPAKIRIPGQIKLSVSGFTVFINSLNLTPDEAFANIVIQLPKSIASKNTCKRATLDLGSTSITPNCRFYVEKPDDEFGPWIIGDTGMVASGKGFIADFNPLTSPLSMDVSWMGIVLLTGEASGEDISPANSNTGYVTGKYSFSDATITSQGIDVEFILKEKHSFKTINPQNYTIEYENGKLNVVKSKIFSGFLGSGTIIFPIESICQISPGNHSKASFSSLTIQDDLSLIGEVDFGPERHAWGELTNHGDEIVVWSILMHKGILYLASEPLTNFSPDTGSAFESLFIPYQTADALAYIEAERVTGVTVNLLDDVKIFSPDRPHGTNNPIELGNIEGWLRIGSRGVDGELFMVEMGGDQELGNIDRSGYVGNKPFKSNLGHPWKKRLLLGQYVTSAVYDSGLYGSIKLPFPCNMEIEFSDMEITSTANLVGGDIILPSDGVELDYWKLKLVPTASPDMAGVVSVRTGRLIFTAAGISEPVHFEKPFGLTWGEILADGNIGELFFDYNNYGQRFDGFQYSPHHIHLSEYTSVPSDAYLATCGTISFNFFGAYFLNIKDARNDASPLAPYEGRLVTVPKHGEAKCDSTDLNLHAEWNNDLVVFDFPDAEMKYNDMVQDGFIGAGSTEVDFIHSDGLNAEIELRRDVIDISLSSSDSHDLDFGLFARVGLMNGISGCVRIEGPTLKRFTINGYIEYSTATGFGIISPKVGVVIDVLLSVTPTSCTFMASGDMLLAVAGASVDISGYVHLSVNYVRKSAEGDFLGIIDCSTLVGGLEAEGQVTWYIDPSIQYLQGRLTLKICGWGGAAGFEGGLFIGKGAPRQKAWVLLNTGSEHFGISEDILPSTITGLYGYGYMSASINLYIIGGGFELFAGMGSIIDTTTGLPNLLGSCGLHIWGEILGGLVSASAWADLDLILPGLYFEGKVGLEGCVLWVLCASIEITAGLGRDGFYVEM